jgi:hypothetical protein
VAADAPRALVAAIGAKHPTVEIRASGMAFRLTTPDADPVKDLGVMIPLMVVGDAFAGMVPRMRSAAATGAVAHHPHARPR